MADIFQPSDKISLIFILFYQRTCMIKARSKYPTDLYGNIYIDAGSRVDKVRHTSRYVFMLDPASKGNFVGMIRQMTTAF